MSVFQLKNAISKVWWSGGLASGWPSLVESTRAPSNLTLNVRVLPPRVTDWVRVIGRKVPATALERWVAPVDGLRREMVEENFGHRWPAASIPYTGLQ
jgi:hypothetical protein